MDTDDNNPTWRSIARIGIVVGIVAALATIIGTLRLSNGSGASPAPTATTGAVIQRTSAPHGTPTPTSSPFIAATNTPVPPPPAPGSVLYRADWSGGLNGWIGGGEWKVLNGVLVNDGTSPHTSCYSTVRPTIVPPFQPQVVDYAVEMQAQVVRDFTDCFGISARVGANSSTATGYSATINNTSQANVHDETDVLGSSAYANFSPANNWHTYRLEVKSDSIKLYIDGALAISANDAKYVGVAGQLGIWCADTYIYIRSFTVTAL